MSWSSSRTWILFIIYLFLYKHLVCSFAVNLQILASNNCEFFWTPLLLLVCLQYSNDGIFVRVFSCDLMASEAAGKWQSPTNPGHLSVALFTCIYVHLLSCCSATKNRLFYSPLNRTSLFQSRSTSLSGHTIGQQKPHGQDI